jgi:hypothetical protein
VRRAVLRTELKTSSARDACDLSVCVCSSQLLCIVRVQATIYGMLSTTRYAHAEEYVRQTAQVVGLELVEVEKGEPTPFTKPLVFFLLLVLLS